MTDPYLTHADRAALDLAAQCQRLRERLRAAETENKWLRAVANAAQEHLAEVDNQPIAPERGGTIGRLRDALDELADLRTIKE